MPHPGWVYRQQRVAPQAQPIHFDVGDSFYTAPGWRELDMEFSLIPDAVYPWDKRVTRAIHSFDPGVIPMWCRWVFMSPQDTGEPKVEVFGRHAIGRRVRDPHGELREIPVTVPSTYHGPIPNLLERILVGDSDNRAMDLPGAYVPWDWNLYRSLREDYLDKSVKDVKRMLVDDVRDMRLRHRLGIIAEDEYRRRDLVRFAQRKLANVSEIEARDHFLGLNQHNES